MDLRFLISAMEMVSVIIVFLQAVAGGREMNMVFYMHDTLSGRNVMATTIEQ